MKTVFKAHPLMIIKLIKPFLFILIFPVLKGVIQYILTRRATGVLTLELIIFCLIALLAALRCVSFRLICEKDAVIIREGFFLKQRAVINISNLSSVTTSQNPIDAIFKAVTYTINTEAGPKNKPDFQFKLSQKDSSMVSELLYGKKHTAAVKYSIIKVAVMAATSSSAFTGLIIGVPLINRAGKLLGIALNDMLIDEINNLSYQVKTYFPPLVNAITLVFLLSYSVAFIYKLIMDINFRLYLDDDKLEVRSGFFVRNRTSFNKISVNDVRIEQSPMMLFFKRYSMNASVGGFGDSKSESCVVVPSAKHGEIKSQFAVYFPFLIPDGRLIHAKRDKSTRNRFLYWPEVYLIIEILISVISGIIFPKFGRLILFLTIVATCIIFFYAKLCLFEYRLGKLRIGNNIFAQSIKGFKTCELYCPKENIGQIKIVRSIPDISRGTCKTVISVRSESADSIKVRHLNYESVTEEIYKYFDIKV